MWYVIIEYSIIPFDDELTLRNMVYSNLREL